MLSEKLISSPTHQVRHICKAHKADTQKPTLQKSCLVPTLPGHTPPRWTQTKYLKNQDEGRTYNREFAAILANE
jgi:hypothetical protein